MKNFKRPGQWKRYIFPSLLLAALCIGGVELLFCYYQAPEIYAAVTAPVRAAADRTGELSEMVWAGLRRRTDAAVERGVEQVQAGLQRLDELLAWEPPAPEEPEAPEELQENLQLVDDAAVAPPPSFPADDGLTSLLRRDGTDYLTGGSRNLVYYDQTDPDWAEQPYGSDTIGRYGCGPTAMAMAVSTLSDTQMDPAQMAQYCVEHGYWASKHGSYWSIVPGVAEDFGLSCTSLPPEETDTDTIEHYLATGHLLVALVGPGHFTNGGHFILLRGSTLDGSVLVADPASRERSLTLWDPALILDELSRNRSSGGPLWALATGF